MTTPLYSLRDIEQRYEGRVALHVDALDIASASIVGVAGPNGSGKSTLMRMLAFLDAPSSGRILFEGTPCPAGAHGVRRKVTLLTQEPYLLHRSVQDNVAYGLKVRGGMSRQAIRDAVAEALDLVGLAPGDFARRPWYALSGGEAQRVAMAARLVLGPRVLLMDEPTASLDEESAVRIREAALSARDQWGTTLIVVSHDRTWLASVSDSILFVRDGRLVAD